MNERIKELRGKVKMDLTKFQGDLEFFKNHVDPLAKIFTNGDNAVLNEYMTKFAELIVRECMNVARQQRNPANLNYKPSERFVEDLRQHFGVEE